MIWINEPTKVFIARRGHGGAEKPVGGYELASFAADVDAFVDAVDLAAAVLVGSSSGGYVAQEVAVDCPDRLTGLVLVGSPRSPRVHDVPDWFIEARVRDGLRCPRMCGETH